MLDMAKTEEMIAMFFAYFVGGTADATITPTRE